MKSFFEKPSTNLWEKIQWKALLASGVWAASKKHRGSTNINESEMENKKAATSLTNFSQ